MVRRSLLALFIVVVTPSLAAAQSSTAQAEALFRRGKELMAQGKFAEACEAFDASQRAEPAVTTQLNQADCRAKNGQFATAWGLFVGAARQTRSASDDEGRRLHKVASERARELEPRLSTLTIVVPESSRVPGLEILRGDDLVDPATWNQALPIDGGTYDVTARAPGNADWRTTVTIGAERDARAIEVPKLKGAAIEAAQVAEVGDGRAADAPVDTSPVDAMDDRPRRSDARSSRVPLLLGGAAIALGGGAVGLALWGDAIYARAEREPDRATQLDLWHAAETRRYAAQGVGVVAVGCAVAAVWIYLRGGGEDRVDRGAAAALHVAPQLGRGAAGVVLGGRF